MHKFRITKTGFFEDNKLLATTEQLEQDGHNLYFMKYMSQQQLEYHANKIKRDMALPASVDNTQNIEDFLG